MMNHKNTSNTKNKHFKLEVNFGIYHMMRVLRMAESVFSIEARTARVGVGKALNKSHQERSLPKEVFPRV